MSHGTAWVPGRSSGIALEQAVFHVWELRDGKAGRLEVHLDRARAEKAAARGRISSLPSTSAETDAG